MTRPVIVGVEAQRDLAAAVDWYAGQRRGLCMRFPYAVYFRAESAECRVVAVLHQAQEHERWRARER